jgi:sigma-E factor negative regulatory protein RseA
MDTHKKIREHISTLSDGALSPSDLELALAALQTADGQQTWNTYHRIGDVLRAQATPDLSPGFAERLAARLAAEPVPARVRPAARAAQGDKRRVLHEAAAHAALGAGSEGGPGTGTEAVSVTTAKPAIVSVS